ncbi:hypothetical protein [Marinobacter sp. MBR-105]|jgi:hypothetical protein
MPSTIEQLKRAWRQEAAQRIKLTLLNQSPRKKRKWREMAGNEPLCHLSALTEHVVFCDMPRTAKKLTFCNEKAFADRMDRLFAERAD